MAGCLALAALVLAAAPASAQTRFAVPLLPGTPHLTQELFVGPDAVSTVGGGVIHKITGLLDPTTAQHQLVYPP
jgi:hypothetical protein